MAGQIVISFSSFFGMKPSHIFYVDGIKNEFSCLGGVVYL